MIKTELIQITKQELKESNEFYNSPNWKTLARFCNDCNKDTFKNKKIIILFGMNYGKNLVLVLKFYVMIVLKRGLEEN